MGFYQLSPEDRKNLVRQIETDIARDLAHGVKASIETFFADEDTYIRKAGYLALGKMYQTKELSLSCLQVLQELIDSSDPKIRQTAINAAGEIGKFHFEAIQALMEKGLFDTHHIVRNAVIGSIKKMGEKNPIPVLHFAQQFLHHPDKEIRREICHGIELRGRTHPQDILPLLRTLQFDPTARVRNTLVHVIGQISYKKGCLETVITDLAHWENKEIVRQAIAEIIDVFDRYKDFAFMSQKQAVDYISAHLPL